MRKRKKNDNLSFISKLPLDINVVLVYYIYNNRCELCLVFVYNYGVQMLQI